MPQGVSVGLIAAAETPARVTACLLSSYRNFSHKYHIYIYTYVDIDIDIDTDIDIDVDMRVCIYICIYMSARHRQKPASPW